MMLRRFKGRMRLRPLTMWSLCAMGAVLLAAGCGSDDSGSGTGDTSDAVIDEAQAAVEEGSGPKTQWDGPDESPPIAKDKSVVLVPCTMAGPGCSRGVVGAKEAAESIGWKATIIDGEGQPQVWNDAIRQGISLGADGIVTNCIPEELVSGAVKDATRAGIKMVDICSHSPTNGNYDAYTRIPAVLEVGDLLANFIIADSEGSAKVGIITTTEFESIKLLHEQGKKTLERCEGCEVVDQTTILSPDLTTGAAGQKAVAFMQKNPDVDYLWFAYDGMAAAAIPALQAAGFGDKVKVVSGDGDPQNLEFISNGEMQVASVMNPLEWNGWASIDQMSRLFAGEEPVDYTPLVPIRLVTQDAPAEDPVEWTDWQAEYDELWKPAS